MEKNCLLKIKNALFLADTLRHKAPPLVFAKPIEKFEIYKPGFGPSLWGITGPLKSSFLNVIASKFVPDPPQSRIYPLLTDLSKGNQIQYLNFKENSGLDKVHMSARYESYSYKGALEMSDEVNSVLNYITGANNYNSNTSGEVTQDYTQKLLNYFNLKGLERNWINSLSNGQMRRARIAKSLINKPRLLLIDDPFLGLDPTATSSVSASLKQVAEELGTSIVLGMRMQDDIPEWITHIGYVNELGLDKAGPKSEILPSILASHKETVETHKRHEGNLKSMMVPTQPSEPENPIIEFKNAYVVYKDKPVLKDFNWNVERGSRWRILGDNGTGKTTILSLITADHPQSWRSVITINGVLRKTGSGVGYFDVNNKIGISSPELHAIVPSRMTMRDVVMNGLVPDVGNSNFLFRFGNQEISSQAQLVLDTFEEDLAPHGDKSFMDLTISQQKLALFLRSIIKDPEILILDEAFSCMDDEGLMMKCHDFLSQKLQKATVLSIGHIDWEVPESDYVLKLEGGPERAYQIFKSTR